MDELTLLAQLASLARYPFLPAAAAYVEDQGPALEELLTDKVYAGARERGRARVLAALQDSELPAAPLTDASPARELIEELLSYVYARILVSALADPYVVRRHALAEAVRVKSYLSEDDVRAISGTAAAVGLEFRAGGEELEAHFSEFLKMSTHLKDMEWKLVRRKLRKGVVEIGRKDASRLVQEALRRRIEAELPKPLPADVVRSLEADLAPIRALATAMKERYSVEGTFGKVDLSLMPPCMQHILGQLQRGENAAHNARFAIVTFLHKIGMSSDEIMALFAQAPDFREDLTRYQVEHITGKSSGTTYSVPGCDNLQTFNLCRPDALCKTQTKAGAARVRFPGDYYRYMQEAKQAVEPIAARVPIAGAEGLVRAGAENYGFLRALQEAAALPYLAQVHVDDVVSAIAVRRLPVKVEGEKEGAKIVFDPADPRAILRLLASDLVASAARRRPAPSAPS